MISRIQMMERHCIMKTLKDKHHKLGWEYNLIMVLKQVKIKGLIQVPRFAWDDTLLPKYMYGKYFSFYND